MRTGGFVIDKSFAPLPLMTTYPNFVTDLVGHYLFKDILYNIKNSKFIKDCSMNHKI
jgi:hypothetical protein